MASTYLHPNKHQANDFVTEFTYLQAIPFEQIKVLGRYVVLCILVYKRYER